MSYYIWFCRIDCHFQMFTFVMARQRRRVTKLKFLTVILQLDRQPLALSMSTYCENLFEGSASNLSWVFPCATPIAAMPSPHLSWRKTNETCLMLFNHRKEFSSKVKNLKRSTKAIFCGLNRDIFADALGSGFYFPWPLLYCNAMQYNYNQTISVKDFRKVFVFEPGSINLYINSK